MLLLFALACTENELAVLHPDIELSASSLDFGEVVVGTQATITFQALNEGRGDLTVSAVERTSETSDLFEVLDFEEVLVGPDEGADISVRYVPLDTSQDLGELEIGSDDPEDPLVRIGMVGWGVVPEIDVDPETLWFGDVEVGFTKTLQLDINARGVGTLWIDDIQFADDEGEAFGFELPESEGLPAQLRPGTGMSLDVTFEPMDDTEWDGSLVILSNDPEEPVVSVRLIGNAEFSGSEGPDVEITSPDWGNYFVENQSVTLEGVITDDADPPTNLAGLWYANNLLVGASIPDESGHVSIETTGLPVGDVTIRLAAMDSDGNTGDDEVDIQVWAEEDPILYTISGGDTIFDYWSVDDDVTIYLDGEPIFIDSDEMLDSHPPVEFEATKGQTLRIVATDVKWCDRVLDALVLHFGTGETQELNAAFCQSACDESSCYDPDFVGPWPDTFVDESFVIEIP